MAYVKYTREMLVEAVAASVSMSDVLRFFGLPLNGGCHAHLRRRLDQFDIDTSHFLGRAHARGKASPRRQGPREILVLRPPDAKRQSPTTLRRALVQGGRPYQCAECGLGAEWNALPLTLQVDHIDGRFWDCRAANLRFLCPNCHTQTATYAGRNRPRQPIPVIRVDRRGDPVVMPTPARPLTGAERADILGRVDRGEITVSDGARMIGCSRSYVYVLRRRLSEPDPPAPVARGAFFLRQITEEALAGRKHGGGAAPDGPSVHVRPLQPWPADTPTDRRDRQWVGSSRTNAPVAHSPRISQESRDAAIALPWQTRSSARGRSPRPSAADGQSRSTSRP